MIPRREGVGEDGGDWVGNKLCCKSCFSLTSLSRPFSTLTSCFTGGDAGITAGPEASVIVRECMRRSSEFACCFNASFFLENLPDTARVSLEGESSLPDRGERDEGSCKRERS